MKTLVLLFLMSVFSFLHAEEFTKTLNLELDTKNIDILDIDCGTGFLKIDGTADVPKISVLAEICIDARNEKDFETILEKYLKLKLEKKGEHAFLESSFDQENSFFHHLFEDGFEGHIDLTVKVPKTIDLNIDDGSGFIEVKNMEADLFVDDGSGTIEIAEVSGKIKIDDGSGDITIKNSGDGISIDDGSGEVEIENAGGLISIDDGTGEIKVSHIKGSVEVDDGSGDIEINYVSGNVNIIEDGSGHVSIRNVDGKIIREEDDED